MRSKRVVPHDVSFSWFLSIRLQTPHSISRHQSWVNGSKVQREAVGPTSQQTEATGLVPSTPAKMYDRKDPMIPLSSSLGQNVEISSTEMLSVGLKCLHIQEILGFYCYLQNNHLLFSLILTDKINCWGLLLVDIDSTSSKPISIRTFYGHISKAIPLGEQMTGLFQISEALRLCDCSFHFYGWSCWCFRSINHFRVNSNLRNYFYNSKDWCQT